MVIYEYKVVTTNVKNMTEKKFYSVAEIAEMLKISRQAVLKKIKSGQVLAEKSGRNYVIERENLGEIIGGRLTDSLKTEIDKGVAMVVRDYDDTLKMLGKE